MKKFSFSTFEVAFCTILIGFLLGVVLYCVLAPSAHATAPPPAAAQVSPEKAYEAKTFQAIVLRVIDGDTVRVHVEAWKGSPVEDVSVRVRGIDTPESHAPPGKCPAEVKLGRAAAVFGHTLTMAGDVVQLKDVWNDKYGGRVDAVLLLPDGRDWGQIMLSTKHAAPYDGGKKRSWC
jgi:micrococcal nuclease